MFFRLMPLTLFAILSVPAVCQSTPYTVTLQYPQGSATPFNRYRDVDNVFGLNVKKILTATNNSTSVVHGRSSFAFMRDWDGDTVLHSAVGVTPTNASASVIPATSVEVYCDGAAGWLEFDAPVFTVWSLMADQGAFVIEASEFSYTGRRFVPATSKSQ
jgi:hypothetical protein